MKAWRSVNITHVKVVCITLRNSCNSCWLLSHLSYQEKSVIIKITSYGWKVCESATFNWFKVFVDYKFRLQAKFFLLVETKKFPQNTRYKFSLKSENCFSKLQLHLTRDLFVIWDLFVIFVVLSVITYCLFYSRRFFTVSKYGRSFSSNLVYLQKISNL